MKSIKTSLAIGAAGVLTLVLAACGGGGDGGSGGGSEGGGVTNLVALHGYTEADGKVLDKIVANFNASQTACQVKGQAEAWASITEKLITSLGAGNGPNLVVQGPDTARGYVNQGAFQTVDAFYSDSAKYPNAAAMYPNMVDAVTWDGKKGGIPMGTAAYAVYYNKKIWADAGLTEKDYPKTVDELLALAKKLTKGNTYGLAAPDQDAAFLSQILHSGGGDYITDGKAAIDSPENVATLQKWQKAFTEDKISPTGMDYTKAMELFGSGRAAMILNGPWEITSAESFGVDVGVFQWPGDWVLGVLNYWWLTNMNKTDAQKECGLKFGDFWNSKEQQAVWTESYYPPNRDDITESEFKYPIIATLAGFSGQANYYASGIQKNANDIQAESISLLQRVSKGEDVPTVVAEAQQKISGYLE
jgi:multiple sugar transport system substrate-binding protein